MERLKIESEETRSGDFSVLVIHVVGYIGSVDSAVEYLAGISPQRGGE